MNELNSDKKFTNSITVSDYQVLGDQGWEDIEQLHETIPYKVYELATTRKKIRCADNHIVFDQHFNEIFVINLRPGDRIWIEDERDGSTILDNVISVQEMGHMEPMFDLQLPASSKHRYFTDGVLSHNTHCAKTLAQYLFTHQDSFIRVDMNEYGEKFSVTKLIGSPPGYVGHEEKGQLTEKVKNHPYSVILLDEIEKAHPDVLNILLQALDEGTMSDSHGQAVNFKNCIIIMTSNIGTDKILETRPLGFSSPSFNEDELVEHTVMKELEKFLKPEVINRIDEKVIFYPLKEEHIMEIVGLELNKVAARFEKKGFKSTFTQSVREFLGKEGYHKKYGARPLKRAITRHVENSYAQSVLKKEIISGDNIVFDYRDGVVMVDKVHERVSKKPGRPKK